MNRLVTYALAAATLALAGNAAHADVTVCNDFGAPVYVALAADESGAVHAAGWWSVDPHECKGVDFAFQGTSLYYTADSAPYRAGGATNRDHWGNKRALYVAKSRFSSDDAQVRRPGTRQSLFGEAVVGGQLRGKPVSVTLRFSPGSTTVSMKSN